jgi:NAD(P)-dependent dehydrogenase (short-subunit alcohol dehydrogenase family)
MAGMVEGKTALVTGAASGIGAAAARIFVREGARVVVSDIDVEGGDALVTELVASGGVASFVEADVSQEEQVEALIRHCVETHGGLDCAFNNAGMPGDPSPLHATSMEKWRRVLAVNLDGVFLCMKHEIPVMQKQGAGAIVNTASGAGVVAAPFMSAYAASKHAILGITKTAAVENVRTGVRVNAICPGSTDTKMLRASMDAGPELEKMIMGSIPCGRLGKPEEIAEAAVWLCSDRASYVSGESMLVDHATVAR